VKLRLHKNVGVHLKPLEFIDLVVSNKSGVLYYITLKVHSGNYQFLEVFVFLFERDMLLNICIHWEQFCLGVEFDIFFADTICDVVVVLLLVGGWWLVFVGCWLFVVGCCCCCCCCWLLL